MDFRFLQRPFYGIPLGDWLLAAAVLGLGLPLLLFARTFAIARLTKIAQRTTTKIDDVVVELVRQTRWYFLLFVLVDIAARAFPLDARGVTALRWLVVAATFFQGGVWGNAVLAMWRQSYVAKHLDDESGAATFGLVDLFARIVLWTLLFLLALDNLNIRVTALVTGLGITGIAVALAVQSALGDVLAAFFIVLDKPFTVGDLVAVDAFKGTVERIGLRSTRLRSTTGELIVIANGDITRARLRNYRRMLERRVSMTVGVAANIPADRILAVRDLLGKSVERRDGVRLDWAHFKRVTKDAAEFEVVYHVTTPENRDYLDAQQEIGVTVATELVAAGIGLVFIEPTPAP